jgi:hypothetical protein
MYLVVVRCYDHNVDLVLSANDLIVTSAADLRVRDPGRIFGCRNEERR